MSSKMSLFCLVLIFFFSLLATAGADDSASKSLQTTEDLLGSNSYMLEYEEEIYISGNTVTLLVNFDHTNANQQIIRDYWVLKDGASEFTDETLQINATFHFDGVNRVQFNIAEPGIYKLYLCGFLDSGSGKHMDRLLQLKAESVSVNDEDTLVIYPLDGGFTHAYQVVPYYTVDYSHCFSKSFYPDLKSALAGKNAIYLFDEGHLRSVYWYNSTEKEVVTLKEEIKPFKAYDPEFIVNLSQAQDLTLNHIFICSEHDVFQIYTPESTVNNAKPGAVENKNLPIFESEPVIAAECDLEWKVQIGSDEKEASSYLKTYGDLFPEIETEPEESASVLFKHFSSFNNLSVLHNDLLSEREMRLKFYPVPVDSDQNLTGDGGTEEIEARSPPSENAEKTRFFLFKRASQNIPVVPKISDNQIHIDITTSVNSPTAPLLSALSFPFSEAYLELLTGNSIIVEDLNARVLEDVNTELIPPKTPIHSVINIEFAKNKREINAALQNSGEKVMLEFEIPAKNADGTDILKEELSVFHVVETDAGKMLEKLEIEALARKTSDNVTYYVLTAGTSGFSPFVIASVSREEEPAKISSPSSEHSAILVPEEEPPVVPFDQPIPSISIPQIIQTIQGHLSLFSIVVVLTSGLFMWHYIRRRI